MLNLKKTAVAVLALGSSAVFAGTMGPVCTPGNVTVPCEVNAWEFGVQALYLHPSYSDDLSYIGATTTTVGLATDTTFEDLDPKWGWGFKLEAGYHFNTGNDLNLNWYHYSKTTNNDFGPGAFGAGDNVFILGTVLPAAFTVASAPVVGFSSEPRWDAVNLELGQHVDFGDMKSMRFHGGFQWARTNLEREAAAITTVPVAGVVAGSIAAVETDSTFNGFGPRVGADFMYGFGNGFGIYANGATALLIGENKFSTSTFVSTTGEITTFGGERDLMVPELEGKVGATYNWAMAQGNLGIDAGWMWVNYFDSLHNHSIRTAAPGAPTVVSSGISSNFALNGPFVGLKWIGSV